jgi:hypothetical protein
VFAAVRHVLGSRTPAELNEELDEERESCSKEGVKR